MKDKVTERKITTLRNDAISTKKDIFCWDTELRGFGAKASKHGTVSYLVQKWANNKAKRIAIGQWPWMKVDRARREASITIGEIYRTKRRGSFTTAALDNAGGGHRQTLEAAFNAYHAKRSKPGSHWRDVKRVFHADIIPGLGKSTLVNTITRPQIRELIEAKQSYAPAAARALFAFLSPFFKFCVEQDFIAHSPMSSMKIPPASKGRERYLSNEEIRLLWAATERFYYPYKQFYQFGLLTGQRNESEIARMKWTEIEGDIWTIPVERIKNKLEHVVHLCPLAVEVLASIPKKSEYVFTSRGTKALSNFSWAKAELNKLIVQIMLEEGKAPSSAFQKVWVTHDFRRTMVTHMASMKIDSEIADRILNHQSKAQAGVAGVYQKWTFLDERKHAIEVWGNHIRGLVS